MSPFDTPKRFAVILGALLVAALAWGTSDAFAQEEATLSIETQRAQAGEAVDVPVQATSFNDVGAVSLTVTYDPAVTSFPDGDVSSGDLISGAPRSGFEASRPEPGELRITWFAQGGNPIDLGDETLLNITFSSFAGGAGNVAFDEANSEVSDAQGNPIAVAFENGAVIDQDAGTVSAGTVADAALNETVSVPLSGQDLQDVGSASFEIEYDTSVLQFEGIANDQSGLNLDANAGDGVVRIAGQNVGGGSLGDAFVEVEFSFRGGSSDLNFLVDSEVTDPQGNVLPTEFTDGSVTGDTPLVSFPDRGVDAGETISVPVQAEDLRAVGAVTLETTYDSSVLTFEGAEEGFDVLSTSNPSAGIVRISGQTPSGIDPSDNGGKFVNLRFSVGQGLNVGTESTLGFNADESELANTEGEPYNTAFESGLVRVEDTEIAVSPDAVSYDVTAIDSTSSRTVTITNESDGVATLEGEVSGTDTPFAIASGGGSFTLAPGESRDVTVDYAPTEVSNPDQDMLRITHNADNEASPTEVPLSGQAEAPQIAAQVVPSDTTVRSGQPVEFTQTVANEATDAAVLEAQVTSLPDFLSLSDSEVTGGGSFDANSLELSLDPGAEATLTYSFQEEVDSTTTFDGAIAHETNDPDNQTVDLPVSITVDPVQVALGPQALDLTASDTELRATDVIADSGDAIVVTTDNGDGAFDDETVVGSTELTEDLDGGEVLVDVEGANPVDHAAHVSLDGSVPGVVATSGTAPIYAVAQFDWQDETVVGETGTGTVDAVEILYEGDVGEDQISINLHEAPGGSVGAFVGVSQEDLAVNQTHTDVAVDVVEPVAPGDDSPERVEDVIDQTGEFFAMAHLGAAGTDADGDRIPAQRPALATTTDPGTVGDFATVEVDLQADVTRTFDDPSDPANYEIIALPGDVDADAAAPFDGTQGPDWRVLREEGGDGTLVNYDGSDAFRFDEGRAFWVIAKNDFTFQDTVDATDVSGIELQDGWNAVSNPLQQDLAWSAVQDANGLDEGLWRWTDSGTWEQVNTLASAQSGEGFYVLNNAGLDSLSLTSSASGQALAAGQADGTDGSSPQAVELTARLQDGGESKVTVGVGEERSVYHAPPAHFGSDASLRVLGSEGDEEYARMIAKSEDSEATAFDLVLRGEKNGGAVLEASGLDSQNDRKAALVVEETGESYDLGETSSITVPTGENGEARLSLHVGTQNQVQEIATPEETKLRGNYPNPFSAQTTLELSISEPTNVKIQVYNVLGQRVATVADENMDAGTHQLTLEEGSLASGTYFVRMEAGDATDVHKITVVR